MGNKSKIFLLLVLFIIGLFITSFGYNSKQPDYLFPIEVNRKYGYINQSGKVIIQPQYKEANEFSEGLAVVSINGKRGYINKTGKFVIKPQFDIANSFSNGLAAAGYEKEEDYITTQTVGYINKQGKYIIKPENLGPYIYDFYDYVVPIQYSDIKCIYKDTKGKIVLDPDKFGLNYMTDGACNGFSEGLLPVADKQGYGYANKTGKIVIRVKAYLPDDGPDDVFPIFPFYKGIATIRMGNKIVYINKKGKIIKNPSLEITEDYQDGLALKTINDKSGYIDKKGKLVIKPQFDYAEPFKDGLARVIIEKKEGYINKSGKFIWFHIKKPE